MATFGTDRAEADPIPYRQFNRGYTDGIANPEATTKGEIADIVRILATLPVDEWLSNPTREYACGLLAGWLPSLATPDYLRDYLSALVPVNQS